jgi:methanogenic corrinoid protein MtbC1
MSDNNSKLIDSVADLQEDEAVLIVKERLAAGDDPLKIVRECQQGMRLVGERYGEGQYYIAGLIMAGEILRQVTELIGPALEGAGAKEQEFGTVLLGTVKEDIHDLGKNIVKMLLSCHGFTVHDLGVDVPPDRFVAEAARLKPDIIGLSGLITASYDSMKETIAMLREETAKWPKRPHIIIGGSQVDEQVSGLVGTDHWVTEADAGVVLCKKLLEEHG